MASSAMCPTSMSLSIIRFRENEPAAIDPLESRTWASISLFADEECVSAFLNRMTNNRAEAFFVPAFPIVRWLITNWWALLYEPCRRDAPLPESRLTRPFDLAWAQRHCLRSCDSGLFLPYFHIYSTGKDICVTNSSDPYDAYPSMPGTFTRNSYSRHSRESIATELNSFIAEVFRWCQGFNDHRVEELRNQWNSINDADEEERSFCRAAGRLGLDPYTIDRWPSGVEHFLLCEIGDTLDSAFTTDLLDCTTEPEAAIPSWEWASSIQEEFQLAGSQNFESYTSTLSQSGKDHGYTWARAVRSRSHIGDSAPISSIENLAGSLDLRFRFIDRNHLQKSGVLAATGWKNPQEILTVAPPPSRDDSARFLQARGLYQALAGCAEGARLVTNAHTHDQQAARAFAAELLAPMDALAEEANSNMDFDERQNLKESLSTRYQVSTEVIHYQLVNHGIWG